jgi:hypothetical protein
MSPEERELLERCVNLVTENNKILRSMRRSQMWANVARVFYWALIIGSAFGAYYFIQPYIDQILGVYGGAGAVLKGLNQ